MRMITVGMIESFKDITGECQETYPCQHGPFEITLKDGRRLEALLSTPEIFTILKELKASGGEHPSWQHFSKYQNLAEARWTTPHAEQILTRIFRDNL